MSLYDKASLIQIPSGYKAGTLYSVIPNSGAGDFTHTRSGVATRVNPQGLIEDVSANVPRLDYSFIDGEVQDCPHLLLEPQRTNNTAYSEDFSSWGDVGVTITPNAIISPDGTTNASKLVSTANNWRKSSSFTASSGVTYTVSIYAKLDTSTSTTTTRLEVYNGAGSLAADYNLLNETISNSGFTSVFIEPVEDDWYRIGGTYTAGGTNNILYIYPSAGYGTAGTMYFWGAQQEAGSYPTSYIATSGSSITRLKDECVDGGNSSIFSTTTGTIFLDFEAFTPEDNSGRLLSLSDKSNDNRFLLIPYTTNELRVVIQANSSLDVSIYQNISYNTRQKVAVSYELNSVKIYVNGTLVSTDTSVATFSNLTKISFADIDNNPTATAKIYELTYFDSVISQSDLETLTTL